LNNDCTPAIVVAFWNERIHLKTTVKNYGEWELQLMLLRHSVSSLLQLLTQQVEFGNYKHRLENEQMWHGTTNVLLGIRKFGLFFSTSPDLRDSNK